MLKPLQRLLISLFLGLNSSFIHAANTNQHEVYFQIKPNLSAWAFIEENLVMLQIGENQPLVLEAVNPYLYTGWRTLYLKIGDYDQDGLNDLAVLQSVGHGGIDRCYAIYRYNEKTQRFNQRKSFDRCDI
ncbi:hypothetical protein [uncultured Thiothrix sp.]|uniref:hypothetical protein n=1 Tax=uncultured Thiothrix sp. TaxID=223185 RepID=UPI002618CFAA|nr:hypothetical protein [uncultured Thiothrix sp.]